MNEWEIAESEECRRSECRCEGSFRRARDLIRPRERMKPTKKVEDNSFFQFSMSAANKNPLQSWVGTWKRTVSQESFGPFVRQRDSVTFVSIEDATSLNSSSGSALVSSSGTAAATDTSANSSTTPIVSSLKWSFGVNLETLRHGYTLSLPHLSANTISSSSTSSSSSLLSATSNSGSGGGQIRGWKRAVLTSAVGEGVIREDGNCISLHLFGASFASIVYRMIDEDTCAVTITELPTPLEGERLSALEVRDKSVASVQHGFMFRVQ